MSQTIYQVDAFTDRPFAGNPAAVCSLAEPAPDIWMQSVAREMNLSETAFVLKQAEGDYGLRWFTPAVEVKLCGHATLASAHILWETGALRSDEQACFHTLSGPLIAARQGDWIEMNFPARSQEAAEPPAGLAAALGAAPKYVGRNVLTYLLEVENEEAVRGLKPDLGALARLPVRALIVTARSDLPEFDFVSRFFAPAIGINEDPATGSAHCYLARYWSARLGKTEMTAYQASSRGGILRVRLAGDRVILGGRAVTVMVGELRV
jgi:PhzF family phenazine biosynthesis protein